MSSQQKIEIYRDRLGNEPYTIWFNSLKDRQTQLRILQRTKRMVNGNFGDHKAIGKGVWEMRLNFGQGYRMYYARVKERIIVLLCSGTKKTQQQDIDQAQSYLKDYKGGLL
ncbi:MAG: type II toxin-antitoxin system RelE/ParE family toxin [Alphaproteobacteria bacterium]